jgi:hypothetical protein
MNWREGSNFPRETHVLTFWQRHLAERVVQSASRGGFFLTGFFRWIRIPPLRGLMGHGEGSPWVEKGFPAPPQLPLFTRNTASVEMQAVFLAFVDCTTDGKGPTHMKRSALFVAALTLVMLTGTTVRADFIPWTYSWTRNPIAVPADGSGTGGIAMTNQPVNHAVNSSDIVATSLWTFSSASTATPDTFTNQPFSLTLALTDDNSHQTTSLTFNGLFNGSLTASSANIAQSWTGLSTQTVTLGNDTYTVAMNGYTPPGPPGSANPGSISAHVDVQAGPTGGGGGGPPVDAAPEPSTLALSGLGLSCLGLAFWRKRRMTK